MRIGVKNEEVDAAENWLRSW